MLHNGKFPAEKRFVQSPRTIELQKIIPDVIHCSSLIWQNRTTRQTRDSSFEIQSRERETFPRVKFGNGIMLKNSGNTLTQVAETKSL